MKSYNEITVLFEQANESFLKNDKSLFANQVSERTLCGALMLHIHNIIRNDETYKGYYTDVEYNRNKDAIKTILKNKEKVININCDLILHSRGECIEQDNLLAIEMKKSTRSISEKNKDRERLLALTKDSFDDVWSWNSRILPKHVCRYVLGVYYEIDYRNNIIRIEYYQKGKMVKNYMLELI